jgi:hypothetical protein
MTEREGVDMRHNMAAAKHAARLAGIPTPGRAEVKIVPWSTFLAICPPDLFEHVEVGS